MQTRGFWSCSNAVVAGMYGLCSATQAPAVFAHASYPKRVVLLQALASGGILQAWPCAMLYTCGFLLPANHRFVTGLRRRSAACVWPSSWRVACGLCDQACRRSAQQQAHACVCKPCWGVAVVCGRDGEHRGSGSCAPAMQRVVEAISSVRSVVPPEGPSRGVMYCPACALCQGCAILTSFLLVVTFRAQHDATN